MSFEGFQDGNYGGHLRYRNGMVLAFLNLYVVPMPPIKFQFGRRCGLKNFKTATMTTSLDIEMEQF